MLCQSIISYIMRTNYLLPYKFKMPGWVLFVAGLIAGVFIITNNYESDFLTIDVLSIINDSGINSKSYFQIITTDVFDEIVSIVIIVGGLFIGFSKERIEDEFIYKLRKDSLVWALIFNYIILLLAIIFVYDMSFFDVLVYNMFTPILFFVGRFTFLKYRLRSHEE